MTAICGIFCAEVDLAGDVIDGNKICVLYTNDNPEPFTCMVTDHEEITVSDHLTGKVHLDFYVYDYAAVVKPGQRFTFYVDQEDGPILDFEARAISHGGSA